MNTETPPRFDDVCDICHRTASLYHGSTHIVDGYLIYCFDCDFYTRPDEGRFSDVDGLDGE